MSKKRSHKQENDIVKTLKSKDVISIYFNEFTLGVSENDIFIILSRNGNKEAVLNASHITAKRFAIALNESISNFEKDMDKEIVISDKAKKQIDNSEKE